MELHFRAITPLHVGDGTTLHSFDYVIHDNRFYRISQRVFEKFLSNIGGDAPERFVTWSADLMSKMDNAERERRNNPRGKDYNQQLSSLRRSFNLLEFSKSIGQDHAFITFLKSEGISSIPIPLAAKGESVKQEIRGFQRSADGQPYLPGSSLKGSIRTALLYHFLQEFADHASVRRILQDSLTQVRTVKQEADKKRSKFNPERYRKSFGEKIEQLAFFSGMIDEREKRRDGEAQDDLLKCLLVSDSHLAPGSVGIENIDLYLVKKLPKGQGQESQRQKQAPAVEALLPGSKLTVNIEVNIDLLLWLYRSKQTEEKGIKIGKEFHWIGWKERVKALFGLSDADFATVPQGAKREDRALVDLQEKAVNHILECCRQFAAVQTEALVKWSTHFGKHDRNAMARPLETGVSYVQGAGGAKLHLGFGTGFEGITAVIHLLAFHKPVFSEIMDFFGIGDSPSAWKNRKPGETYRANPDQFPKSRRLITRQGVIFPMGWLEWIDDPNAGPSSPSILIVETQEAETPKAPVGPKYLRGSLKTGAEVDAELLTEGNPGRFKLFVRADYEPMVDIKYPAGFKAADIGRLATIRVKNIKGKEEVTIAEFVRFK